MKFLTAVLGAGLATLAPLAARAQACDVDAKAANLDFVIMATIVGFGDVKPQILPSGDGCDRAKRIDGACADVTHRADARHARPRA